MPFGAEKGAISAESESYAILLRYGLPTCAISVLLAYLGNDLMRVSVLVGSVIAYRIVAGRRVYPFDHITRFATGTRPGDKESEEFSSRLEGCRDGLRRVALVWFMVVLLVCGFSIVAPLVHVNAVAGTDLFDNITKVSVIFSVVLSLIGESYRPMASRYFVVALRVVDHGILVSLSLFFSITGSACLYWFFIHRDAMKSQETPA